MSINPVSSEALNPHPTWVRAESSGQPTFGIARIHTHERVAGAFIACSHRGVVKETRDALSPSFPRSVRPARILPYNKEEAARFSSTRVRRKGNSVPVYVLKRHWALTQGQRHRAAPGQEGQVLHGVRVRSGCTTPCSGDSWRS